MLARSLHVFFSFRCLFNSVKPLTTEITENKTTPKFCKITVYHYPLVREGEERREIEEEKKREREREREREEKRERERERERERGRERERKRERERERERERKRERERGGGEKETEGGRGKVVIAKRILNGLEKYAHHSSWLMGRFGTPTATFGSPCRSDF